MKLAQSVDCLMTTSDHFGLAGQVRNANGRGDGFVAATWRRAVSPYLHIEVFGFLS
jgi:hypothetical protein